MRANELYGAVIGRELYHSPFCARDGRENINNGKAIDKLKALQVKITRLILRRNTPIHERRRETMNIKKTAAVSAGQDPHNASAFFTPLDIKSNKCYNV